MNINQISQGILAKFEQCRLVIWEDLDNEFNLELDALEINNIEVIKLDEFSHFQIKQRIELLEPTVPFLLYTNKAPNEPTRDWLYDIRLYAPSFYADSSSMILNELGMRIEFRPVVSRYRAFFANKKRVEALKKLLPNNANKEELEMALMAVCFKLNNTTFDGVIQHLALALAEHIKHSETIEPLADFLAELDKYQLTDAFWQAAKNQIGYHVESTFSDAEDTPQADIYDLFIKLFFTECYQACLNSGMSINAPLLQRFKDHLLPIPIISTEQDKRESHHGAGMNSAKRAKAVNIVKSLRENRNFASAYNIIANSIETQFELKQVFSAITDPYLLTSVETFEFVEKHLLILLAKQINELDHAQVDHLIAHRLTTHWAYSDLKYAAILKAIKAAKQFYCLKHQYVGGFNYPSALKMYRAYESDLYKFDLAYREFCKHALFIAHNGSDILKATKLVADIEKLYVDWYLHDLAIAWGKHIDNEQLLESWKLKGVPNQYDFYDHYVEGTFNSSNAQKVFVIISDALRYEVAHEIYNQLNNENKYKSEIKSQLGVVPSYTKLGMAALLPHQHLTAHIGNHIEYRADGISTEGIDNRNKILRRRNGIAFKATEVLNWTNEECRQKVQDARVVYIYHDQIDAIGDKAVTENQTFDACADAISEMRQLIERIIHRLKGSRILVTADHGFLFKTSDVVDSDKTTLAVKPHGVIESHKRYLIGQQLPNDPQYWYGKMAVTANLSLTDANNEPCSNGEFIVPRGSNRFNFMGGAKFIHGGIMPQEICVPVLKIQQLTTTKQQKAHIKEKVNVVPLGNPLRLVSLADKIEFLQTEAVNDTYAARKLEIWIETPDGNIVSNKQKVIFDAILNNQEDRKRKVIIMLNGSGFDRTISYKLMLNDITQAKKPMLLSSYSVTIDIAFEDDLI